MKTKIILTALCCMYTLSQHAQSIMDSVYDYDGNIYYSIPIGSQVWLDKNLKTTHFSDGTPILNITDNGQWSSLTTGAYCNFNNSPVNAVTYGRLYNWFAVIDNRKLCPSNYHIPTDAEWSNLVVYLGGETIGGGKLKSIGTIENGNGYWYAPNTGATNSTNFTAQPGNYRSYDGTYGSLGISANFFSSTEYSTGDAYYRGLTYNLGDISRDHCSKTDGLSVRCIWDFSVGLQENINIHEFKIYPNPVHDIIFIEYSEPNQYTYSIFNSCGMLIMKGIVKHGINKIYLNSLPKGLFIIRISNSNISYLSKLIKN